MRVPVVARRNQYLDSSIAIPADIFVVDPVHLKPPKFYEERSMSINSSLSLSNSESSKKPIMPSLISSNCEMSSKCMDESLEEGSRLQQHYCITLGVGPLWWS